MKKEEKAAKVYSINEKGQICIKEVDDVTGEAISVEVGRMRKIEERAIKGLQSFVDKLKDFKEER